MKTIYLETSAINQCWERSISGDKLTSILSRKQLIPIISIHTTYELCRTFLDKNTICKGGELFQIIKSLNPTFTCWTCTLVRKDINKLRDDEPVTYNLNNSQLSKLNEAVDDLAKSIFRNEYRKFILDREGKIRDDRNMYDNLMESTNDRPTSFENFVGSYINIENIDNVKTLIYNCTNAKLNNNEANKFIQNMNEYRALRTLLYSNFYLNFISLQDKNRPGKDKVDDLRHLIDSSYCSSIISNDKQLLKITKYINPDIEELNFNVSLDWWL